MSSQDKGKQPMTDPHHNRADPFANRPKMPGAGSMIPQGQNIPTSAEAFPQQNPFANSSAGQWTGVRISNERANPYAERWNQIRPDRSVHYLPEQSIQDVYGVSHPGGAPSSRVSSAYPQDVHGHGTPSSYGGYLGPTAFTESLFDPSLLPLDTDAQSGSSLSEFSGLLPAPLGNPRQHETYSAPRPYFPRSDTLPLAQSSTGKSSEAPTIDVGLGNQLLPSQAQLPRFGRSQFRDSKAVQNYLKKPAWFPAPGDYGVPTGAGEYIKYVAKVYNALIDQNDVWDKASGDYAKFQPGGQWSNPRDLEAISHILVDTTSKIHQSGVRGLLFRRPPLPVCQQRDFSFTFAQRIQFITVLLEHFKAHASQFMMQICLEEYAARVWSILCDQPSFQVWWSNLLSAQQERFLYVFPYAGMEAQHPNNEEREQLMAKARARLARPPSAAATDVQAQSVNLGWSAGQHPGISSPPNARPQQVQSRVSAGPQSDQPSQGSLVRGKRSATYVSGALPGPSSKRRHTNILSQGAPESEAPHEQSMPRGFLTLDFGSFGVKSSDRFSDRRPDSDVLQEQAEAIEGESNALETNHLVVNESLDGIYDDLFTERHQGGDVESEQDADRRKEDEG